MSMLLSNLGTYAIFCKQIYAKSKLDNIDLSHGFALDRGRGVVNVGRIKISETGQQTLIKTTI